MKRWVPVLGVVALLAAVWLAAQLSSPDVTQLPFPQHSQVESPPPSVSQPPLPAAESGPGQPTPWWVTVLLISLAGLLVLVFFGIIVLLLWMLLRSLSPMKKARLLVEPSGRGLDRREEAAEVLAAVDAGLVDLSDADTDPRRAVIACWVRLERAAATAGTPREIGDSPTDLVTRLLSAHRVSRAVLDGFAEIYREARYATHPIGERSRQTAIAALRQVRAELAAEPAAGLVGEVSDA